jgi:pimeloyl-ACP methyl ester carboxylesterase
MTNFKTILFIHGLHENAHSWHKWKLLFEALGYECHSPSYPYHAGIPSDLRQHPDKRMGTLRLKHVIEHYTEYIEKLPGTIRPILIGHSMGGLIAQKLIQNRSGSMGICITSAPPKGVMSFKWSFVKSNFGVVNPFKGNRLYCGTKNWFHYAICNLLSRQESDEINEGAIVPESRNIPRSSSLNDSKIDFNKPHTPLLFIGAEKEHIIPVSLNFKNYTSYKDKQSITEFKGRSHIICVQSGWHEVSEFVNE